VQQLKKYKVRFKDGSTQEVEAETTRTTSEFVYFQRNGEWIHQVAAGLVESVGLADIPEPTRRAPRSAAVQLSNPRTAQRNVAASGLLCP
jgi:hypothetical protein